MVIKKQLLSILIAPLLFTVIFATKAEEVWITVYIHGIMSITPHLNVGNFMRFMNDNVLHTLYAKQVEFIRNDPFFQYAQAMQQIGLHKLDPEKLEYGDAGNAIAAIFNEIEQGIDKNRINHHYTFGWTGLLSPQQRYYDAHELFVLLEDLVREYEHTYQTKPKIRLIGYSHGGNISLNLAAVRKDFYPQSTLQIDQQVLIGVPLVTETDFLVNDPIFKRTYHIFSSHDRIQQIDLFSFSRLFSRKVFKNRHNFKLPDNLWQIQLKTMKPVKKMGAKRDALRLNMHNEAIVSGTHPLLKNVSPGHIELWFFGWTPQHYRPHFILNPLPVVVFLPYIINAVHACESFLDNKEIVIFDIRPKDNLSIVKQYREKLYFKTFTFFSQDQLDYFASLGLKTKPDSYTNRDFKERIYNACQTANRYYRHNIKPMRLKNGYPNRHTRMRQKQTKPLEYK
ncbi:hypothetical protein IPH25_03965 [bacterium]|nr:MAG: hypothetical protein IPG37_00960 [bacterium]QQR61605.1 MAG: hypothetical protein IPH25_03965 [bacterium]